MDDFWKKVYREDNDRKFYFKVLNTRRNLLNECIIFLDVCDSNYGYIYQIAPAASPTYQTPSRLSGIVFLIDIYK